MKLLMNQMIYSLKSFWDWNENILKYLCLISPLVAEEIAATTWMDGQTEVSLVMHMKVAVIVLVSSL